MATTNNLLNNIDSFCVSESTKCQPEICLKSITKPTSYLKILQQNIRSINKNFDEICILSERLNLESDIIVLSECWLSYVGALPTLDGFESYSTAKNYNQNDGVVVLIKKQLAHTIEEPDLNECNCLLIKLDKKTMIIAIYRPWEFKDVGPFLRSLKSLLEKLRSYENIILVGDININIIKYCEKTMEYLDIITYYGLAMAHNFPTRMKSCLDHVAIKTKNSSYTFVLETALSDHEAVLFCLKTEIATNLNKKTVQKINLEGILTDCKNAEFQFIYENNDLNNITTLFVENLSNIILKNTSSYCTPCRKTTLKPWMTAGLLRCLRNRDQMYKKLKKDKNNETLRITYSRYRNYCSNLIKKIKRQYETQLLNSAGNDSKQLWKTINTITNRKKGRTTSDELLKVCEERSDSLKIINLYFANIGKELANKINMPTSPLLETNKSPRHSFVLNPTDCTEVLGILKTLKGNSSAGYDGVTTEIFKSIQSVIVTHFTYIVNTCIERGVFPDAFKKAVLVPIYKTGNKNSIDNYRPIAILSTFSKIFEKIVNSRLCSYLETNSLLADSQFGFRKGKSTSDAVHEITDFVVRKLDKGKRCLSIFLDLRKAFDTVSIPILINKLEGLGIRGLPLLLLSDYLNNRTQRVKVGDFVSGEIPITYGVPQGSVLGPTLFLCYVNELCNMKLDNCKIIAYADDTSLTFFGDTWEEVFLRAQEGFDKVCYWLASNSLTLNAGKTKYIRFSMRNVQDHSSNLKITAHTCSYPPLNSCSCENLHQVSSITYLGVILDRTLTFQEHILGLTQKVRKLIYLFKQLRHVTNGKTLRRIYISLCQSITSYCVSIWGGTSKGHLLKIERAQRLILKICLFKPILYPTATLYADSEMLTVRQLYVLNTILMQHTKTDYTQKQTVNVGRRYRKVCHSESFNSSFASRFFCVQGPKLYDKINAVLNVYPKNKYVCRKILSEWLKKLSYQETEDLLKKTL